jgi:hypothetical protein
VAESNAAPVEADEDREDAEQEKRRFIATRLQQENAIRCSQLVGVTCTRLLKSSAQVDPHVLATATLIQTQSLKNVAMSVPLIFPAISTHRRRPTKIVLELVDAVRPALPAQDVDAGPGQEADPGASPAEGDTTTDLATQDETREFEPAHGAAVDLIAGMFGDDGDGDGAE